MSKQYEMDVFLKHAGFEAIGLEDEADQQTNVTNEAVIAEALRLSEDMKRAIGEIGVQELIAPAS